MKLPAFEYVAPRSLEEVLTTLEQLGDEAKVLAGGQSLLPLMAFRLAQPAVLIDLANVHGLDGLSAGDEGLTLGALVTHRNVELNRDLGHGFEAIVDAVPLIGHVAIRNRGTVGGSVAHADPQAEWPALLLLFDATVNASNSRGERSIDADGFFTGWFTTGLHDDELLTGVGLRRPPPSARSAFVEIARRHGDFALAGAAVVLDISDGEVSEARVALVGSSSTPRRASESEASLIGSPLDAAAIRQASEIAVQCVDESSESDTSKARYRQRAVRVVTERALRLAGDRALNAAA